MESTLLPHIPANKDDDLSNGYIKEKSQPQPHLPKPDDKPPQRPHSRWSAMSRHIRFTIVLLLALTSLAMCYVAASPPHRDLRDARTDPSERKSFSALLSSVSEASVKDVLHKCVGEKYKDGVYPDSHTALKAIQKENAALATTIAELAKRQTNQSNSSVSTIVTIVTPARTITTTSTSFTGESSTPVVTDVETLTENGSTFVTSILVTPSASQTPTPTPTPTPSNSGSTTSPAASKTNAEGGGSSITPTPSVTKHTSVFLLTTTLPNGSRSVITSTTVVAGSEVSLPASATGATGTPALQNGARPNYGVGGWGVVLLPGILGALVI